MISDLNNNKTKNEHLKNQLGKIKYSEDEDYSSFYFKILNNGFLKYLQYFPELLHLEQNDIRLEKSNISKALENLPDLKKNKHNRESHLLEFLIYGCKGENGKEILPQGNRSEINNSLDNNYEEIREIMKGLLNSPSKIKIINFISFQFYLKK